jgi:hypothetical protein
MKCSIIYSKFLTLIGALMHNKNYVKLLSILLLLILNACARINAKTLVGPPDNIKSIKEVNLLPLVINSREQDPDTISTNKKLEEFTLEQLKTLLDNKLIIVANSGIASLRCKIDVDYGNRAMRYFVGLGGIGTGYIKVKIDLKDNKGVTIYSAKSDLVMQAGLFGGDMYNAVYETVQAAIKEFGEKL